MDKNTVIIYTLAYNSEAVIERTIQSVLNQTYTNWIWHLVDNGCTDSTGEIIRKYAASDSRIIAHRNEKNCVYEKGNSQVEILAQYDDEQYWARIDADDEFMPDCFEKVLAYGGKHDLDMICYATVRVNEKTGVHEKIHNNRDLIIINDADKADNFPELFMSSSGAVWGYISKIKIIETSFMISYAVPNLIGNDCISTAHRICISNRIGVLADILYKYYIHEQSVMGEIFSDHNKNLEHYHGLFKVSMAYKKMLTDFNLNTDENNAWISENYGNTCIKIFNMLSLVDLTPEEKLEKMKCIIDGEYVSQILDNSIIRYRFKHMFVSCAIRALKSIPGWRSATDGKYVITKLSKMRRKLKGYYLWQLVRNAVHLLRRIKSNQFTS